MRAGLLVVCFLVLAGCSESADNQPSPQPSPTDPSDPGNPVDPGEPSEPVRVDLLLNFQLQDCNGISIVVERPLDDVQALLPEPFVAVDSGGNGLLGYDLYSCSSLTTPTATVNDTWFGQAYAMVEAPEFASTQVDIHEFAWRILAAEDILETLWLAAGFEVYAANSTLSTIFEADDLELIIVNTGDYRVTSTTIPTGTLALQEGFARYSSSTSGGFLEWTGSYSYPDMIPGAGRVAVPADDAAAGLQDSEGGMRGDTLRGQGSMIDQNLYWHPLA